MPKATAIWLIENTSLTFEQISDFVGIHPVEIQAMADGDSSKGVMPRNPVTSQQLTEEEVKLCEEDPSRSLKLYHSDLPAPKRRLKGQRYTPLVKRAEKPDAIAWIIRYHPELSDLQISRLLSTTKPTIQSIRSRTYWNYANIKMRSPVELGLTSQDDIDSAVQKAAPDSGKINVENTIKPDSISDTPS